MRKYLYLIKKQKIKSWLKFWLLTNNKFNSILSNILEGISFDLQNTVKRYFKIFNIFGNSVQDGTPSPENPVPIESVADDGILTIKLRGKNLAYTGWAEDFVNRINNNTQAEIETKDNKNCLFYTAGVGYGDYDNKYMFKTEWKENTQYTIQCSILNTSSLISNNYNLLVHYTDGTSVPIFGSYQQNAWISFNFTTALNKTVKYITSAYYSGQRYLDLDTFMVYEGTEESSYEPYQANDFTFQTSPLRSLPNGVRDTLEDDGIHRRVGRVVFDGSEDWIFNDVNSLGARYFYTTSISNRKPRGDCISNYFRKLQDLNEDTNGIFSGMALNIVKDVVINADEFKTWLSTHNTEVLYELETEVIEPYTEEQQAEYDKIKELYTFDGTTNISSDDEVPPYLQIQYYMKGE